jgi:hypothetical protein
MTHRRLDLARLREARGISLIETSIACVMMVTVLAGLASLAAVATMHTENEGHLSARTTEYAQDKMEQLLALAYTDSVSNTIVFPAASSGGTGLTVGGSTTNPVNGYVDWLGTDGSLLGGGTAAPTKWFYKRLWQISSPTTGLKQMTVTVTVRSSVGGALLPKSTVVAVKAWQF